MSAKNQSKFEENLELFGDLWSRADRFEEIVATGAYDHPTVVQREEEDGGTMFTVTEAPEIVSDDDDKFIYKTNGGVFNQWIRINAECLVDVVEYDRELVRNEE